MSWQEREREIDEALSVLRKQQQIGRQKKRRSHQEAMLDRAARMVALERGVCRDCEALIIEIRSVKGKRQSKGVALECRLGESPLELHRDYVYQPEETPECSSQVLFEQEEKKLTT